MKFFKALKQELPVVKQAAKEDIQDLQKKAKLQIQKASDKVTATIDDVKMTYGLFKMAFITAYAMRKAARGFAKTLKEENFEETNDF